MRTDINDKIKEREELIKRLREEANNVKDCFTRFSFQCLAFSGLVLGYIAKEQPNDPFISLAGLLVTLVSLTVARIGTYKYATANRHFGFELHLERSKYLNINSDEGWSDKYWFVGWEEAMRAWRIVQASIYEKIYNTKGWKKDTITTVGEKMDYKWFMVSKNINRNTAYYPGNYLKEMHHILHSIAFIGWLPICISIFQFFMQVADGNKIYTHKNLFGIFFIILALISLYLIIQKSLLNHRRRKILEDGLLSIHSCSIVWQAVIVAHYKALEEAFDENETYKGYSYSLSKYAVEVNEELENIQEWSLYGIKKKRELPDK